MKSCLNDVMAVRNALRASGKASVVALHKFVFEHEGDRGNRKRLRNFQGFTFNEDTEEYNRKFAYINGNLNSRDLVLICAVLRLNHNVEDIKIHIFRNLCKNRLAQDALNDDDDDDDDNEDDGDEEVAASDDQNISNVTIRPNSQNYLHTGNDDNGDDDDDDDEIDDGNEAHAQEQHDDESSIKQDQNCQNRAGWRRASTNQQPRFVMNFRDVEDSVTPFDGSNSVSIESWVNEFEETAMLLGWDELQMLIFAKKSLKGLAKLFIAGERGLTSWIKLKTALLNEFKSKVNSRQIHKLLTERSMRKGETVLEYLYKMKEIAARGKIVDRDLIHYVIDGIKDANINKQMLYGADTLRNFKEKLQDYEIYSTKQGNVQDRRQTESKAATIHTAAANMKTTGTIKKTTSIISSKCYNCGEDGHKSSNCKDKIRGTKCFNCNNFGHLARDCKDQNNSKKDVGCLSIQKDVMMKKVEIADQEVQALIDTGSKVNVMKHNTYRHLKLPKLCAVAVVLAGFGNGNNKIRPLGCFDTNVLCDDEYYTLTFYVVPDNHMSIEVLIGAPICDQAELTISNNGIHTRKVPTVDIMKIEVQETDDDDFDIETTISAEAKLTVRTLVENYKPEKTKSTNVTMKIVLTDETPLSSRPRRLPIGEREVVEEQIDKWLDEGIIENSESEFSSPIVLVNKKDGSKRLCVDYRKLNRVMVKDRFPLPLIEDQLDRLSDAKIFSTIDLRNGFFHVAVDESSRKYTSFVSHSGQYQFKKVPFGLSNSPPVFQRYVNAIFRELTQKGIALPYIDDVIIPARTEEEAISRLEQVLILCKDYGLDINFKKSHFLKKRIEFLGHVIENQRISPSPGKVEAMLKYPVPNNVKKVESFLGLAGYFRKFIPNFSLIAKPLSDLKKKNAKFIFQTEHVTAFNKLKQLLSESPVLKIFNVNHQTELHTDASADGYGAVLMQKSPEDGQTHPVHYMSKKTTEQERKYTSYELEILAVIQALKKFRVYLLGIRFKVITDCNAFAKTMHKQDLSTRVARWLLLLQEYDYEVEHRSGTKMRHVDALSRQPIMMITAETTLTTIKRAQANDEHLKQIIEILTQGVTYEDYYLKVGVLYKLDNECEKIVIPISMQHDIIRKAHEKGHFALQKTKELISSDYFIPKLEVKIQRCIDNCMACLLINRKRGKQEGTLKPLPKPDTPLHTYHVDFIGPLETTSKMYRHILVVVDSFSKFCWLYPTRTTSAACAITKLTLQSVTFGNPMKIITDRGSAFTAEEFQNYCKSENIAHLKITTGLPRANGQVERLNAVVAAVLAKLAVDEPTKWYKYVEDVQRYINSTFSRSTNFTPFELLTGVKMRLKDDLQLKQMIEDEMMMHFDENRDYMRKQAKLQILNVQDENRHSYNLRRKAATRYKKDDHVAIKRTQLGGGLKLKAKYLGPYQVTKVKPNDTYDVVKVGESDGPIRTTSCAEFMKPWPIQREIGDDPFETNV